VITTVNSRKIDGRFYQSNVVSTTQEKYRGKCRKLLVFSPTLEQNVILDNAARQ